MTKQDKKRLKKEYFNKLSLEYYNQLKERNILRIVAKGKTKSEIMIDYTKNVLKPRPSITAKKYTTQGYKFLPKREDYFYSGIIKMIAKHHNISYSEAKQIMSNFDRALEREALDNLTIRATRERKKILGH